MEELGELIEYKYYYVNKVKITEIFFEFGKKVIDKKGERVILYNEQPTNNK